MPITVRYQVGVSRKLAPSWECPHHVVYAPFNAPNVILRLYGDPEGTYEKVHMQRLKKYTEWISGAVHSFSSFQPSPPLPEQVVQQLVQVRLAGGVAQMQN